VILRFLKSLEDDVVGVITDGEFNKKTANERKYREEFREIA
jgi:hypothetical protein